MAKRIDLREAAVSGFIRFVKEAEPKLSYAFYAAHGPEVGSEITAEVLAYAWEHWDRIEEMGNAVGYLYRVGQSKARWYYRPRVMFPASGSVEDAPDELMLVSALEQLTRNQRLAVVLVHAMGWTESEVGELVSRSRSTVRTHLERGLRRLRVAMEVRADV